MKPRYCRLLFTAALLLQTGLARAQSVEPESAAKISLGGMAAAGAAIVLGNSESTVYSTIGTSGEVILRQIAAANGPLPPGGAAGIAGAGGTSGSSQNSSGGFAAVFNLVNAPITTLIVISTATSTTSSTGTSP